MDSEPQNAASDNRPVALVTGGSAGLGRVIAATFSDAGYRIVIVGRDQNRLDEAARQLKSGGSVWVDAHACQLTHREEVARLLQNVAERCGRLDVLVNCVGTSDRGLIENLDPARLEELLQQNVMTTLLCSQAALPLLEASGGTIVNIGSLSAKVGARYLGGYSAAKHALAGLTQQMRLELRPRGIHVALVNPGPIARADTGQRYQDAVDSSLPASASRGGGGTRIKGLPPQRVADAVLRCVKRRKVDIVLPGYLRILIAVGHALPGFGDWLLLKFTSVKDD